MHNDTEESYKSYLHHLVPEAESISATLSTFENGSTDEQIVDFSWLDNTNNREHIYEYVAYKDLCKDNGIEIKSIIDKIVSKYRLLSAVKGFNAKH